jgi:hypothetical protein
MFPDTDQILFIGLGRDVDLVQTVNSQLNVFRIHMALLFSTYELLGSVTFPPFPSLLSLDHILFNGFKGFLVSRALS